MEFFKGRTVGIVTLHGKERVIAPVLRDRLGLKTVLVGDLNTDSLGTFSGEVERVLSPLEAAREKCRLAMELSGLDMVVSSEGSFGAHPDIFFAKANEELVMLMDRMNNLEIVGRKLSLATNFNGTAISEWKQVQEFAEEVGFPDHGLILRAGEKSPDIYAKGICAWKDLKNWHDQLQNTTGQYWVETDMRAMHNPMRMEVIREATEAMVDIALSTCPKCSFPGFTVVSTQKGLPCELCNQATDSVKSLIYGCKHCGYEEQRKRPDGKTYEEASFCNFCNP